MKKVHIGDRGNTKIFDKDAAKSDNSIGAVGSLDELNSFIGLCRSFNKDKWMDDVLERIQRDIFSIGSEVGYNVSGKKSSVKVENSMVAFIDQKIVETEGELAELSRFILPGGGQLASLLHVARSVCRRAERKIVKLSEDFKLNGSIVPYVNRLSDLLFSLARYANKLDGIKDVEWKA